MTRRNLLAGASAAAVAAALTGCSNASDRDTLRLIHGATGGGLKDTLDPHFPVTYPDISRVRNLYEPLFQFDTDYVVQPALAVGLESSTDARTWTIRLRDGVTFHHGKSLTADDVHATFERAFNPDNVGTQAGDLASAADMAASGPLDDLTYRLVLKEPLAIVEELLAAYGMGIIPTDFDLENPVGTGAFKADLFVPGQRSRFLKFSDYWEEQASVDELIIIDFADDAAKVNAMLAGQIQSADNLPTYLVEAIRDQGGRALISESGGWLPFTMRVDLEPFSDPLVRQALRLMVNRQELIDQALNGFGTLGNDLYSPFDPGYASDLPQREHDPEQAAALLAQAGQSGLQIEVVTSTAVGSGGVEAANLFSQQAKLAGVGVRVNKVDSSTFYGEQYLQWPFAQDFWATRNYIPQAAQSSLASSPYNETHFDDPEFEDLIKRARAEVDTDTRNDLVRQAQQIEFDTGGFIIWGFKEQVDAYSQFVEGLVPSRDLPMSSFLFKRARLTKG
ncbi:MAG: ABC transporter substrate-binding protein [Arachnia sp.]